MTFLTKTLDIIDFVVTAVIGMILALTVILIGAQVFSRYLLSFTTSWSEEIARFANVWITILGACAAIRIRGHISLDYTENFLSGNWKKAVRIFNALAVLLYFVLLGIAGYHMTSILLASNQVATGTGIPLAIPYSVLAVSGILAALYSLEALFKDIAGKD